MIKSEGSSMREEQTVESVINQIQSVDYTISIYMELVDHLNTFVKNDFGDPKTGIRVWRGGAASVPEDFVQKIQDDFRALIEQLKDQQNSLNSLKIEEPADERKNENKVEKKQKKHG
jgi:hypothetical protein